MAETKKRIIQYNEELIPALDDYLIMDSPTAGTRKILALNIGGGGGNANVTELTYAQYMALTPAERADGTIYMVTDDPNDSGVNVPINYSTAEQDTGLKWIDGKPIYQKTFSETSCPNNSSVTVASLSSLNIENVVDMKGFAKSNNQSGYFRTLPFCGGGANDIRIDVSNFDLRIVTYGDWSGYNVTITVYYTKTTD